MKYETKSNLLKLCILIVIIFFFVIYAHDCFSQILIYDENDIVGDNILSEQEINDLLDELIELEKIDDSNKTVEQWQRVREIIILLFSNSHNKIGEILNAMELKLETYDKLVSALEEQRKKWLDAINRLNEVIELNERQIQYLTELVSLYEDKIKELKNMNKENNITLLTDISLNMNIDFSIIYTHEIGILSLSAGLILEDINSAINFGFTLGFGFNW